MEINICDSLLGMKEGLPTFAGIDCWVLVQKYKTSAIRSIYLTYNLPSTYVSVLSYIFWKHTDESATSRKGFMAK